MTDLEKQIFARYGTPPTTEKKSETMSDIIARARQNAVTAPKNTEIEWNTKTITEYFFSCVNTHVNFRNRQMVLTEDFKESSKKIIEWIDGGHLENRWLLLSGNVGNGKTTAAKAAGSVFQRMGQQVVIKNAYDISLLYKDIDKKQRAADEYTALSNASILLIDDLGTESNHQSLSEILYNRYNSMLATIFTTNLEYPDLAEKYGDRIFDRFEELVEIVPFKGESFRKKS